MRSTHTSSASKAGTLAHETIIGRPNGARKQQQTTKWRLNAYLHSDRDDILPLDEHVLDGRHFGGKRNYGYGVIQLKNTQIVDLDALDYSRLRTSKEFHLELVTPFVLKSEYPDAHDQAVPWWWQADRAELRERQEQVLEQRKEYTLQTIDHGQVVTYEGDRPVETAKRGYSSCWKSLEIRIRRTPSDASHSPTGLDPKKTLE